MSQPRDNDDSTTLDGEGVDARERDEHLTRPTTPEEMPNSPALIPTQVISPARGNDLHMDDPRVNQSIRQPLALSHVVTQRDNATLGAVGDGLSLRRTPPDDRHREIRRLTAPRVDVCGPAMADVRHFVREEIRSEQDSNLDLLREDMRTELRGLLADFQRDVNQSFDAQLERQQTDLRNEFEGRLDRLWGDLKNEVQRLVDDGIEQVRSTLKKTQRCYIYALQLLRRWTSRKEMSAYKRWQRTVQTIINSWLNHGDFSEKTLMTEYARQLQWFHRRKRIGNP